jgi:hypothetical protein
MTKNLEAALEIAHDAESWHLDVRFGSDMGLLDEGHLSITARVFNTLVHFLPPTTDVATWRLASEDVSDDDDDQLELVGEISVAQVIDAVPQVVEDWVLDVTLEAAAYFAEADDVELRRAGMRLHAEHEQGQAHSARGKADANAHHGDVVLYDFAEDAELQYERTELDGHPALLMTDADEQGVRVLLAPNIEYPWRGRRLVTSTSTAGA